MMTEHKRYPAFEDTDLMPFGKYKGESLQDVPASYFRWLWDDLQWMWAEYSKSDNNYSSFIKDRFKLANYIWNSHEALEQELGDTFI